MSGVGALIRREGFSPSRLVRRVLILVRVSCALDSKRARKVRTQAFGPNLADQSRRCRWSKFLVTASPSWGIRKPSGDLGVSCRDAYIDLGWGAGW